MARVWHEVSSSGKRFNPNGALCAPDGAARSFFDEGGKMTGQARQDIQWVNRPVSEVFGVRVAADVDVLVRQGRTEEVPAINPDYRFCLDSLRVIHGFFLSMDRCMQLVGHKGCGKTTLVEQYHARTNIPLIQYTAHPRTELDDLLGHFVMTQSGGMRFHEGPVLRAAKQGLSVLVDEFNVMDPGVATGLNAILQGGGRFYVPQTEESVSPHPEFRFFATGNMDEGKGLYAGRQRQDVANDDRFWFWKLDYPGPDYEVPLVQAIFEAAHLDVATARTMAMKCVDVANKLREQFIGVSDAVDALEVTMSTRSLIRWARLMTIFRHVVRLGQEPVHFALEVALTHRPIDPSTKLAIHAIVESVFNVPFSA
ncbi:MAG: AAA family ATPase [Pseudomonadota bacterium]|nr:AAA family ATPase [Pseudomonadota bacterium]